MGKGLATLGGAERLMVTISWWAKHTRSTDFEIGPRFSTKVDEGDSMNLRCEQSAPVQSATVTGEAYSDWRSFRV